MSCADSQGEEKVSTPKRSPTPCEPSNNDEVQPPNPDHASAETSSSTPTTSDVARPPSPVPTEIFDDSIEIVERIQNSGVKIRDFAYGPPYVSLYTSVSTGDAAAGACSNSQSTPIPHSITPGVAAPTRPPETFDPYLALTEIDYFWSTPDRILPVTGKTMRRLLDIGWLSQAEISAKAEDKDVTALRLFDEGRAAAREANGGKEAFPWTPVGTSEGPPTPTERAEMLQNRRAHWITLNKRAAKVVADAEWRRLTEERIAERLKAMQEEKDAIQDRVREEWKMVKKRRIEDGFVIAKDKESPSAGPSSGKRRRLSPEDEDQLSGTALYPARRVIFDPALLPPSPPPTRVTPPIVVRPSAPGPSSRVANNRPSEPGGSNSEMPPPPPPKTGGLQRSSLRRTQTFADFG